MADDELELNALNENETELFEEMENIMEGEGGDEDTDDLEHFLNEHKLSEHLSLFRDQQIDFETLMILTETDLKRLGLPLGPFRKLIIALQKKKMENEGTEYGGNESESKAAKEESDMPALADEGSFRIIDESGDDSDAHSVKSDHEGVENKDDSKSLADEFKEKVELEEPLTVEAKTVTIISDSRRLKTAIKELRKEKAIAVEAKCVDTYEKTLALMQISTKTKDYLLYFSKMRECLLLMTDIFVDPNIVKVFYDAKHEVKNLQKHFNLFTINAYCVRSAVKELKYEASSLYSLINKYVSYFKPTDMECAQFPLRHEVKINLRKETNYLLHLYYKTQNEALEAGSFDTLVAMGMRVCSYLHTQFFIFSEYDKFNDTQKLAAEELSKWRETLAKDKNVEVSSIMTVKDMKELCLSLPIKKEELLQLVDTRIVHVYFLKLLAILKAARKKYFTDPKDESKLALKEIVLTTKSNVGGRPPLKASPKPAGGVVKPDLKRKSGDNFARPGPGSAKKPRFNNRSRKNFNPPKRNSFENKTNKSPKISPFRSTGYRGGYQGKSPNAGKNYQHNSKYANP
ncbi:hypothetical protein WA026_001684 [Henosepilachna vigintioctopunctata]|uniref:HRDC domain-containing protein n=1 Tax=Henosepilachna vigintioctopunctata TaxID=420089 RepID=A0AAW1ULA4_9CUCU